MSQINEALFDHRNPTVFLPWPYGGSKHVRVEAVQRETFWPLYHGTNNYQNFAGEWERVA